MIQNGYPRFLPETNTPLQLQDKSVAQINRTKISDDLTLYTMSIYKLDSPTEEESLYVNINEPRVGAL